MKSHNEIHSICSKFNIKNYDINPDGTIDVDGDVILVGKKLTKLPLRFNRVTQGVYCLHNQLVTLEGGPKKVGGYFNCYNNKLTSLEGFPEQLEYFNFDGNPIFNIYRLFKGSSSLYQQFRSLLEDYNYIRGNKIIKVRFEQVCIDAGIKMPEKIEGYEII